MSAAIRLEPRDLIIMNAEFDCSVSAERIEGWPEKPIRIEVEDGADAVHCYLSRPDARALAHALWEIAR